MYRSDSAKKKNPLTSCTFSRCFHLTLSCVMLMDQINGIFGSEEEWMLGGRAEIVLPRSQGQKSSGWILSQWHGMWRLYKYPCHIQTDLFVTFHTFSSTTHRNCLTSQNFLPKNFSHQFSAFYFLYLRVAKMTFFLRFSSDLLKWDFLQFNFNFQGIFNYLLLLKDVQELFFFTHP